MSKYNRTLFSVNESYEAETLEQKIEKIMSSKEPIDETAPIIYTERKKGVQPEYNIRTDRFEIALEAMDKVSSSHKAQREDHLEDGGYEQRSLHCRRTPAHDGRSADVDRELSGDIS